MTSTPMPGGLAEKVAV